MERLTNVRISTLTKVVSSENNIEVTSIDVSGGKMSVTDLEDNTYELGTISIPNANVVHAIDSKPSCGCDTSKSNVIANLIRAIDGKDGADGEDGKDGITPDMSDYYDKNDVDSRLKGKQDTINDLDTIRSGAERGASAVQPSELASVAKSGLYDDLKNKPTIPSAVTESTISGWGFTKNNGDYSKPSGGIPKTDLADSVQTSLSKADDALSKSGGTVKGKLIVENNYIKSMRSSVATFFNIASFTSHQLKNAGTLVINLWNANMFMEMDFSIAGYNLLWDLKLSGYTYSASNQFHNPMAMGLFRGITPKLRAAINPDGVRCFLLGDVDTEWGGYIRMSVYKYMCTSTGANESSNPNVTISLITDESGYSSIKELPINDINVNNYLKYEAQDIDEEAQGVARGNIGALGVGDLKTINGNSIVGQGYINVQGDWDEVDLDSPSYINNRTHYFQAFGVEQLNVDDSTIGTIVSPVTEIFSLGGVLYRAADMVGVEFNCQMSGPSVIVTVVMEDERYYLKHISGNSSYGPPIYLSGGHAKQISDPYIPDTIARVSYVDALLGNIITQPKVEEVTGTKVNIGLLPNVIYALQNPITSLTISGLRLSDEPIDEYTVHFYTGNTGGTLTITTNVVWANGDVPSLTPGTQYELSILRLKLGKTIVYKAVLTPFK